MTDDFERRVRDWLRERGRSDRDALEALAGYVAVLPPRRPDRRRPLAVAAAIVVLVGLAAFALPRAGQIGEARPSTAPSEPRAPQPPDPAAFSGDPRVGRCFGPVGAEYVFEIAHARDFRRHLPRMGRSPELDVDDPALVVVFAQGVRPPVGRGGAPSTTGPGDPRAVCVLVDDTPNLYEDVDITGLRVVVPSGPDATDPAGWNEPAAYTYVLESTCGERALLGRFRVHVRDGETIAFEPLDEPASRYRGEAVTIPSIAGLLREAQDARGAEEVTIEWTPNGRPTSVRIDWQRATIDDEACYTITDYATEVDPTMPPSTPAPDVVVWTDVDGHRVEPSRIFEREDCYSGSIVRMDGKLFVRDPTGQAFDPARLLGTYAADAELPADAADTGYRRGDAVLYLAADARTAYIVDSVSVERLPRVKGDEYQRTDCN